ncbi:shikimate dehydrogenase family protein [Vibrio maerlii]|uniref:shikimate dehydrogenase family protein n=1 Tax=Vibrio maerlii TaxID=2231648 RepID=UPI000E3DC2B0|nr:shikimate dehydrogenase [Vibrio maerlii]
MIQCRLIGQNIQRSQSPAFHNELAAKLSIELNYELDEFNTNCTKTLTQHAYQLFEDEIDSANVTYPYKEQILNVADKVDHSAERVGAANTLVKEHGKIVAYNTDYSGFITAFKQFGQSSPGNVVLLGCGGVGKAICFSLADLQATHIAIYDRDLTKMNSLATRLAEAGIDVICLKDSELEQYVNKADGVLNCTPVGHYQTPGCPINPKWLKAQKWVFDAVYIPHETEFILAAQNQSIDCLSGFELFFHQANDAFTLFTGIKASSAELNNFKQIQLAKLR